MILIEMVMMMTVVILVYEADIRMVELKKMMLMIMIIMKNIRMIILNF